MATEVSINENDWKHTFRSFMSVNPAGLSHDGIVHVNCGLLSEWIQEFPDDYDSIATRKVLVKHFFDSNAEIKQVNLKCSHGSSWEVYRWATLIIRQIQSQNSGRSSQIALLLSVSDDIPQNGEPILKINDRSWSLTFQAAPVHQIVACLSNMACLEFAGLPNPPELSVDDPFFLAEIMVSAETADSLHGLGLFSESACLSRVKTLEVLSLNFDSNDVAEISTALGNMLSVTALSLGFETIGTTALSAFARILEANDAIKQLILKSACKSTEVCDAIKRSDLLRVLQSNTSIETLALDFCLDDSDESQTWIRDLVTRNTHILCLFLRGGRDLGPITSGITEGLLRNKCLRYLTLSNDCEFDLGGDDPAMDLLPLVHALKTENGSHLEFLTLQYAEPLDALATRVVSELLKTSSLKALHVTAAYDDLDVSCWQGHDLLEDIADNESIVNLTLPHIDHAIQNQIDKVTEQNKVRQLVDRCARHIIYVYTTPGTSGCIALPMIFNFIEIACGGLDAEFREFCFAKIIFSYLRQHPNTSSAMKRIYKNINDGD